ncbi:hypothetical protein AB0M28_22595 [Streptomyces sp. NPDC051940]|uniref:hypothetical protein n=1 Tax=Streptomyces sp. NPDC051940 TaxID=3155675 RepID=UPI00343FF7DD
MTLTSVGGEPAVFVRGERAYVGSPEFSDPGRRDGHELFDVTEITARRIAAQRLELSAAVWERAAGGRPLGLMLVAHSSLPDLRSMGETPVRVNNGAVAELISLAPSAGGTEIVVRIRPWGLPAMWPVGLRVCALGVIREASVPAGLVLPRQVFRRGLRRLRAEGAIDPLGRLVVLTSRGR